ncbi:hypothetical protein MTO96_028566 [Rhipicephalus appendiculatus]
MRAHSFYASAPSAAERRNSSSGSLAVEARRVLSVQRTRPLNTYCSSARDTPTFAVDSSVLTANSDCHT